MGCYHTHENGTPWHLSGQPMGIWSRAYGWHMYTASVRWRLTRPGLTKTSARPDVEDHTLGLRQHTDTVDSITTCSASTCEASTSYSAHVKGGSPTPPQARRMAGTRLWEHTPTSYCSGWRTILSRYYHDTIKWLRRSRRARATRRDAPPASRAMSAATLSTNSDASVGLSRRARACRPRDAYELRRSILYYEPRLYW